MAKNNNEYIEEISKKDDIYLINNLLTVLTKFVVTVDSEVFDAENNIMTSDEVIKNIKRQIQQLLESTNYAVSLGADNMYSATKLADTLSILKILSNGKGGNTND